LTERNQILKSASVISLLTVFSRVLGYARDQRITLLLGTSPVAGAFVIAYRIPSVQRRPFGEGSMTASFIPVLTEYLANGSQDEIWVLANRLFWTLAAVLAAISGLGMIFSSQAIRVLRFFHYGQPVLLQAVYLNP
jgi:putative peptidoglycan lipid II flippase